MYKVTIKFGSTIKKNIKQVMSKIKKTLKQLVKDGLLENYEITLWTLDEEGSGSGSVIAEHK